MILNGICSACLHVWAVWGSPSLRAKGALYIKIHLSHVTPKSTTFDVASCFIILVRRLVVENFSAVVEVPPQLLYDPLRAYTVPTYLAPLVPNNAQTTEPTVERML